ncbi:hypothetical protein [Bradyrhizobium zhanjiangense]|uniref:hypothetical protein n=1 Tax=Bradyrhizobium zhanjiangense TaxID=1325107 RepID=UPI00100895F8|nr:hypothetical protein [Bradyrhizobium zhanjiangense]
MVEGAHDRVSAKPKSIWLLPSFLCGVNCRRVEMNVLIVPLLPLDGRLLPGSAAGAEMISMTFAAG